MAVTIYDVAKQADVGVGTVSRVLNNHPQVSPETRQRVLSVIQALNYRPSPMAQRLSRRKTLAIGVIAVFFTRPSVVERLRGVEAVTAASEYDLIVYNVETPAKRDAIFRATADNRPRRRSIGDLADPGRLRCGALERGGRTGGAGGHPPSGPVARGGG